jgi:hypothetical protein
MEYSSSMIILIHVLIALASIGYTSYVFLFPSESRLKISYGFIAATFVSGTYLVVREPAHLTSACITGLVYLSAMTAATIGVHYRLKFARERAQK